MARQDDAQKKRCMDNTCQLLPAATVLREICHFGKCIQYSSERTVSGRVTNGHKYKKSPMPKYPWGYTVIFSIALGHGGLVDLDLRVTALSTVDHALTKEGYFSKFTLRPQPVFSGSLSERRVEEAEEEERKKQKVEGRKKQRKFKK
ncbi:hypothetical protein V2J09_007515 [Rumex salicifolius]